MSNLPRFACSLSLLLGVASAMAADAPNPPPAATAASSAGPDMLEFSGVSTVGKRTMINLYDKQEKRSFWIEAGTTSAGVTVVGYDSERDQVTVKRNGQEKVLPLRPPSAVVNGNVSMPTLAEPTPTTTATPALPAAPTAPLSQARQEEEARMLVSDLLEIGMAQRRAYEEAQKRAASGQSQNTANVTANATATPAPAQTVPPVAEPSNANAPTPTGGPSK